MEIYRFIHAFRSFAPTWHLFCYIYPQISADLSNEKPSNQF